jgi:catechol 2,3-dioxygenase-like lactoylglutathione lyase family enzyme
VNGIHHVGATVTDLDRSVAFYEQVLDGRLASRIQPGDDPRVPRMVGIADAAIEGAMVETAAGARIELLVYDSGHSRRLDVRPCDAPSLHLAFAVPDLTGTGQRVRAAGGTVLGDRVRFDDGDHLYCADPDGNVLELVQPS